MTLSPVQKALLCSACVSGGIFTATAVPFAMYSSQPVEVEMQNQSVFASELSALSGPYLGVTGAFSVALGTGILGLAGWRLAASKSESEKAKASELERNLKACKATLERMQFSDSRLKAQNLGNFLEPQAAQPVANFRSHAAAEAVASPKAQEIVHRPPTAAHQPQDATLAVSGGAHSILEMAMHGQQPAPRAVATNGASLVPMQPVPPVQSSRRPSYVEKAPEHNLEALINQVRVLEAQVEDLQSNGSRTAAA